VIERRMVVIGAVDEVCAVERAVVELVARQAVSVHLVSTDVDTAQGPFGEFAPRRLRLMLLLAKLADRGIEVTGEDVSLADPEGLGEAVARFRPDVIHVVGADPAVVEAAATAAVDQGVLVRPLQIEVAEVAVDGWRLTAF
jgi:hypothetical protein